MAKSIRKVEKTHGLFNFQVSVIFRIQMLINYRLQRKIALLRVMRDAKHHGLALHCIDFFVSVFKRHRKVRQTSVVFTERTNDSTISLGHTTDLTHDFRHMVLNHFFDLSGFAVPISTDAITDSITRQHQTHVGVDNLTLFPRFVINHERRVMSKARNDPFLGIVML